MGLNTIIRSVWFHTKHQPVLSIVTIAGTALSIFLIMIVVMMQDVMTAPYAPESNRDRFLHYPWLSTTYEETSDSRSNNGPMAYQTAKELLLSLPTPEAATVYQVYQEAVAVSVAGGENLKVDMRAVDNSYWKVFDFAFVDGKPFSKADFDSALPVAVITESVARSLFGTSEAAGREMQINLAPFRVAGVVKDVSPLATKAYSQVWTNLSATSSMTDTWGNIHGYLAVTLLARDRDDFTTIRDEYDKARKRFDDIQKEATGQRVISRGRPYDQATEAIQHNASGEPDLKAENRRRLTVYLILLIVPAINLSSMTQSRLKQRIAEIGVRRSFGCTRSRIITDIIVENLGVTIIAGLLGLLMSVIFGFLCNDILFAQEYSMTLNPPTVDSSILIHWSTFAWAMLFCFILNLLSSGLPAFNASRTGLVNALSGHTN